MIEVRIRRGEPFDDALERFERKVEAEGIMEDLRRHLHYQKPSEASRLRRKGNARHPHRVEHPQAELDPE